jgi:hypothetical protein
MEIDAIDIPVRGSSRIRGPAALGEGRKRNRLRPLVEGVKREKFFI